MDLFNSLPSFNLDFDDPYSCPLDLIEQAHRFNASIPTSTYQGMSVQTLDSSFPGYHNQSDIADNNPESFNLLNKYDIEPLTLLETDSGTADFFGADTPDIPTSVPDEYIVGNSGHEPVNDAPPSIPDIPFIQQICLSGSDPEISEPTPESDPNPDYLLTAFPDILPNPQDLRPWTVVNPLKLNQNTSNNQTTRSKDIVDHHASMIKSKRHLCKDPALEFKRKRDREYKRELHKNPAFLKRKRERKRERYHNDPGFAESHKARNRQRYQNDPDYAERHKARNRQRYQNDPDYAERHRKRARERKRRLRKDLAVQNSCTVHV